MITAGHLLVRDATEKCQEPQGKCRDGICIYIGTWNKKCITFEFTAYLSINLLPFNS